MRAVPSRWGKRAGYIAVDPGSFKLKSVLAEDLPYIGKPILLGEEGKPYDPYDEVMQIATMSAYADVDTFILDTGTVLSREILQAIANSGSFSDRHVEIKGSSKKFKVAMSMPGDYGAAQNCMFDIFRAFKQSGKNFICIFHDGLIEPEASSNAPVIGGPITAGKGSIMGVAAWFDNLVRVESKNKEGKRIYRAFTEKNGVYLAKLRMRAKTNPIPVVDLDPDPINFWLKLEEVLK
jgi:hypothetical protein